MPHSLSLTLGMRLALAGALAALLGGCTRFAPPAAPPPPQVGVVVMHAQPVPLTRSLVGRLSAMRSADVRARVAGVLLKRLYTEGSDVKAGQPLFQIDPAPLRAALLGVLMIPVCYVAVRRLMGERLDEPAPVAGGGPVPGPAQQREE